MEISIITKLIIGFFLGIMALEDMRKKTVSLISILIFLLIGIAVCASNGEINMKMSIMGVIMGTVIMLFGHFTEMLGVGDGVIMMVLGILIGVRTSLLILMMAFFIAAFISIILLIIKKISFNQSLPFVPYIFLSFSAVAICS